VTFGAVVVAFLALDDITTDDAPTFVFERLALVGCGLWFVYITYQLGRGRRRSFALVSAAALALAALAQPGIGPDTVPSAQFEYLATVGGLAWFLLAAGGLAGFAWYARHGHAV
jgi:hypothetical protein